MCKYVDRILDEIDFNFERHFRNKEEREEFLEELIEAVQELLNRIEDDECGICPEGECDCDSEPYM